MRTVYCARLQKEAPGLKYPPLPGELGKKIFDHISQEAWMQWLKKQTMLINEHHLNLASSTTRVFLSDCMQRYLFNGEEISIDITPPSSN